MISVCMATYNGEKYIMQQIHSILKQLGSEDELIISDDGSEDNTCDVIKQIRDPRIKYLKNEGIHGFTHNFEYALLHASGDYIFLSDQDDVWLDEKVEITMKALGKSDLVISDCITVDENFKVIQQSRFREFNIKPGFLRHLLKSRYLGCCMAFNRKLLDSCLPFPRNDFLVEHDIWIAAVGFLYYKVDLIGKPLIYYRRHGGNASGGGFERGYSIRTKCSKRIYRMYCLLLVYFKKNRRAKP